MAFYFENTKKEVIMTEEVEEDFKNNNICRFCEKNSDADKFGDNCHLTGKYRGPAQSIYNNNVTQKQNNFIPIIFHNFSTHDWHMFFEKLVDKKNDKVEIKIKPKTNEEYISVTNECTGFKDSYKLLSSSLDSLVKTLVDNGQKTFEDFEDEVVDIDEILKIVIEIKIIKEDRYNDSITDLKTDHPNEMKKLDEPLLNYMGENDPKLLKTGFPDKWKFLSKILVLPDENFDSINDYQKPVDKLNKEYFFSKKKYKCPDEDEI